MDGQGEILWYLACSLLRSLYLWSAQDPSLVVSVSRVEYFLESKALHESAMPVWRGPGSSWGCSKTERAHDDAIIEFFNKHVSGTVDGKAVTEADVIKTVNRICKRKFDGSRISAVSKAALVKKQADADELLCQAQSSADMTKSQISDYRRVASGKTTREIACGVQISTPYARCLEHRRARSMEIKQRMLTFRTASGQAASCVDPAMFFDATIDQQFNKKYGVPLKITHGHKEISILVYKAPIFPSRPSIIRMGQLLTCRWAVLCTRRRMGVETRTRFGLRLGLPRAVRSSTPQLVSG